MDKGELIAHILQTEKVDPAQTLMIGDRKHDILGARKSGIRTLGVLYGYGSREELTRAGADALAVSPGEIASRVLG